MSKCPDRDTLEKLLNEELSESANAEILGHLSVCEGCRNNVRCFVEEDADLLKQLLMSDTISHRKRPLSSQSKGGRLSRVLLLAYSSNCLSGEQSKVVETHLEVCDECLRDLIAMQKNAAETVELDFDLSAMIGAAQSAGESMREILVVVLKVKDNMLELLRHTGEVLLVTPQFAMARGEAKRADDRIAIRKDFEDTDLSLEITVSKDFATGQGAIRASVMSRSTEKFLSGLRLTFMGAGIYREGITDNDGLVEFIEIAPGKYELAHEDRTIASIVIE